jgi:GNAT superfamily N-acetyltransferase
MIHVERATREDLPAIWAVDETYHTDTTNRATLMRAVDARQCLVAKQGWAVIGYAVRETNFFAYPLVRLLVIHTDHRRQGVARQMLKYIEMTTQANRIFTCAHALNHIAQATYTALGYTPCGGIDGIATDNGTLRFFCKSLSSR